MGYDREVAMIAQAREMDLLTCPYVHNEDEARAMAEAGADILVPHIGLTTKGMIGAQSAVSLDEAAARVQAMADAAHRIRDDLIVLCHGGPIAEAGDVEFVFGKTRRIAGFFGASSIERLPTGTGNHRSGPKSSYLTAAVDLICHSSVIPSSSFYLSSSDFFVLHPSSLVLHSTRSSNSSHHSIS